MERSELKPIVEGALLAAGRPLSIKELGNLFDPLGRPDNESLRAALDELAADCEERAYELREVASGFRFQVRSKYGLWISRLWEERPPKYSRALLETLALVAYKQPLTRGEVEDVRGVAVSTNIIRTLLERNWIRVVGHRDVPGKPALYATTKEFLDYFNLKNLNELPTLADIKDIASINQELDLEEPPVEGRSIELPVEEGEADAADPDDANGEQFSDESVAEAEIENGLEADNELEVDAEAIAHDGFAAETETETETESLAQDERATAAEAAEVDAEVDAGADAKLAAEADVEEHAESESGLALVSDSDEVPEPDAVAADANFDSLPN